MHLFGSEQTAREFFEGQGVELELLSMDQASAYAEQTHGRLIRAAQEAAE